MLGQLSPVTGDMTCIGYGCAHQFASGELMFYDPTLLGSAQGPFCKRSIWNTLFKDRTSA